MRIMLVEDSPTDTLIVRKYLTDALGEDVEITCFERLSDALTALEKVAPRVVLLDLNLPDSTGLATLQTTRAVARSTPIVILSGTDDDEIALRAVEEGAEDYISKQQMKPQLLAKTVRFAIERSLRREAEARMRIAANDMAVARNVQAALYPRRYPEIPGYDFCGDAVPSDMLCGDYYDVVPLADGKVLLAVGDVTSHGLGPALVMVETRACLRTLIRSGRSLEDAAAEVNNQLVDDSPTDRFVSLFVAILDPASGRLQYVAMGHQAAIIHSNGEASHLRSTDTVAGIHRITSCHLNHHRLLPGDVFCCFTDGYAEARNPEGEFFGETQLLQVISAYRNQPAVNILRTAMAKVVAFSNGRQQEDDMTALIVRRTE